MPKKKKLKRAAENADDPSESAQVDPTSAKKRRRATNLKADGGSGKIDNNKIDEIEERKDGEGDNEDDDDDDKDDDCDGEGYYYDDDDDEDDDDDDDDDEEIIANEEDEEDDDDNDDEGEEGQRAVWRPGVDTIEDGEQLDFDPESYTMFHKAQVEWPCLSFDIMHDDLGAQRTAFPMTAYVVAGTQATKAVDNRIYVMKWHKLYKTVKDGREDTDSEDDESGGENDDDHNAQLEYKAVPHPGGVNRIRSLPQASHIVATWADSGKVHMWNLETQRKSLDKSREKVPLQVKPIYTCEAHKEEGFALDFSPHDTGRFLSGSNDGAILLWDPVAGGWSVSVQDPFSGHTGSVEDVVWKRTGVSSQSLFASCSSDRSVRIWDVREKARNKCATLIADAHKTDVNVISWSPCVGELLISGSDDGGFKIWDTRSTAAGPMANFLWHKKPITSVHWHPTDETVLTVACEDNSVSIWDMAVEEEEGHQKLAGADHFPAQLLFLHQGMRDPKEVRWHPQLPGVCLVTAATGFNIFKSCNM